MTDLELIEAAAKKREAEESKLRQREEETRKIKEEQLSSYQSRVSKMLEICQNIHEHHLDDVFRPGTSVKGALSYGIVTNALFVNDFYSFSISSGTYFLISTGKNIVKKHFGRHDNSDRVISEDLDLLFECVDKYEPIFYRRFHEAFGDN